MYIWETAEEIRSKFAATFEEMEKQVPETHKQLFEKCKNKILGIEYAAFWIENRDFWTPAGIDSLSKQLASGQLRYKGSEYSDTLSLD